MSRIRTLVLFAALAALATAFAACGGGGNSSSENPQKVIDAATLEGVTSGDLNATVQVKASGKRGGDLEASLSGPFQSEGKENLPELDLTAKANGTANGHRVDFEGGATLLSDRAFVNYKGTEYEVDPTTFSYVKSGFERAERRGGAGAGGETACQEAAAKFKPGELLTNLTNEGSAEVEGTSTTKISGDLDSEKALEALLKISEDPACSSQLESVGALPRAALRHAEQQVGGAVKQAHVALYVGDDHIIRRVVAELVLEPNHSAERVEINYEFTLGKVNEEQSITVPSGAKPLEQLFQQLGINPLELLQLSHGGEIGPVLKRLFEGFTGGASLGSLEGAGSGGTADDSAPKGGSLAADPAPAGSSSGVGASGGGASSGGASSGGSSSDAATLKVITSNAARQAYLKCLRGASDVGAIQKCIGKLR